MNDYSKQLNLYASLDGFLSFDSESKTVYFYNLESAKTFKEKFSDWKVYYKTEIK